jgi:hypothetical protein
MVSFFADMHSGKDWRLQPSSSSYSVASRWPWAAGTGTCQMPSHIHLLAIVPLWKPFSSFDAGLLTHTSPSGIVPSGGVGASI